MNVSGMVNRLAGDVQKMDTPGDYRENGIVHCAVCGEPKQTRKQFPDGSGGFVEVQGTAEGKAFTRLEMNALLALAEKGIGELVQLQTKTLSNV